MPKKKPADKRTIQPKLSRTDLAKLQLKELQELIPDGQLARGAHDIDPYQNTPEGVCLMEAVAWVSGERHTDHPPCACPVLTNLGIEINDSLNDTDRQRLIPAIPALVGSNSGSRRTYFKRAVRAGTLIAWNIIQSPEVQKLAKTSKDPITRAICRSIVDGSAGQRITKKWLSDFTCLLDYLKDGGALSQSLLMRSIEFLDSLREVWNSDGISYGEYESLFGDASFTQAMPRSELPEFFVEVATTHA